MIIPIRVLVIDDKPEISLFAAKDELEKSLMNMNLDLEALSLMNKVFGFATNPKVAKPRTDTKFDECRLLQIDNSSLAGWKIKLDEHSGMLHLQDSTNEGSAVTIQEDVRYTTSDGRTIGFVDKLSKLPGAEPKDRDRSLGGCLYEYLNRHQINVVVCDLHLLNDKNDDGIEILKWLDGTGVARVLYTADNKVIEGLAELINAHDFKFVKQGSPPIRQLPSLVVRAAFGKERETLRFGRLADKNIVWPKFKEGSDVKHDVAIRVARKLTDSREGKSSNAIISDRHLNTVLRRLATLMDRTIVPCKEMNLTPLKDVNNPITKVRRRPVFSAKLKREDGSVVSNFLVKFVLANEAADEIERYRQFVHGQLGGFGTPAGQIVAHARYLDVGALAIVSSHSEKSYAADLLELITNPKSTTTKGAENQIADVRSTIEDFFSDVWAVHYYPKGKYGEGPKQIKKSNGMSANAISATLDLLFGNDNAKAKAEIEEKNKGLNESVQVIFDSLSPELRSNFLDTNALTKTCFDLFDDANNKLKSCQTFIDVPIHGDLHLENIHSVGKAGVRSSFVIDFGRTGYGNFYWDVAELVCDILYRGFRWGNEATVEELEDKEMHVGEDVLTNNLGDSLTGVKKFTQFLKERTGLTTKNAGDGFPEAYDVLCDVIGNLLFSEYDADRVNDSFMHQKNRCANALASVLKSSDDLFKDQINNDFAPRKNLIYFMMLNCWYVSAQSASKKLATGKEQFSPKAVDRTIKYLFIGKCLLDMT